MQGRLRASLRSIAATLAVALLLPGAGYAENAEATESTSAGWQHHTLAVFDAVVVRPLGVVAIVVGAVFVIPVAVVTWPTGRETIDRATERFVKVQARSVFERPLGDF
jgi:multisubunit Na+/H+ antiporter MnhG subunit